MINSIFDCCTDKWRQNSKFHFDRWNMEQFCCNISSSEGNSFCHAFLVGFHYYLWNATWTNLFCELEFIPSVVDDNKLTCILARISFSSSFLSIPFPLNKMASLRVNGKKGKNQWDHGSCSNLVKFCKCVDYCLVILTATKFGRWYTD